MRADGHRVPDLHQERLHVVRQPETLRIRVFDRHQDIFHADHRPLGHRLDGFGAAVRARPRGLDRLTPRAPSLWPKPALRRTVVCEAADSAGLEHHATPPACEYYRFCLLQI